MAPLLHTCSFDNPNARMRWQCLLSVLTQWWLWCYWWWRPQGGAWGPLQDNSVIVRGSGTWCSGTLPFNAGCSTYYSMWGAVVFDEWCSRSWCNVLWCTNSTVGSGLVGMVIIVDYHYVARRSVNVPEFTLQLTSLWTSFKHTNRRKFSVLDESCWHQNKNKAVTPCSTSCERTSHK